MTNHGNVASTRFFIQQQQTKSRMTNQRRQAGLVKDSLEILSVRSCSNHRSRRSGKIHRLNSTSIIHEMCALSSSSKGAMLRRRCDPTDVVRGSFSPMSRRNLSAASVLHADRKNVDGQEGLFLTWLKAVFNKPAENNNHKADATIIDRAATATTFDYPKIAASKRPADSSSKVDVVNQKLANFGAAQSMTKFEDGNHRIEKHNAKDDERANAIQQLAIYASSQSSRVEAGKTSWLDPGKIHRSERNGDVIEFVAKDNLNVAAHYRCYMNPTHCYRLPPRTKQALLGSLNRNISVPMRPIVGFAPRNSKPPIREPNMPEKRERKDEKKDRKEKKKPVIRTDGESVDSSENRAEMVADDNPKGDPDAAFRYEWGVKLAEESAAEEASDNDNFAEKGRRYVTKRLWGVNLKQPKPDVEDAASPTSESSERSAEEHRNASPISESSDTTADEAKRKSVVSALNVSKKKPDASNLKGTIAEYLSTPSHQANLVSQSGDFIAVQEEKADANLPLNSEALRKIMRTSPNMLKETIEIDNEYNVPEGVSSDAEISAWKNLVIRSKTIHEKEDFLSTDNMENLEMLSIRPEAPQPKLDVQVVRSAEDDLKDKEVDQSHFGYKSMEFKRSGSPQKPDGYSSSKKLHTASMQIRYMHRHTSSVTQQYAGSLPISFVPIDRTAQMKCPRFTSAFSTNPEDSMPKKVINEASTQQNKQQTDAKSHIEGKSNNLNANDSLNSKEPPLSIKSQTFPNNSREQVDAVFVDKETEISMNQSQDIDHEKTVHLSNPVASPGFTKKDESRFKDEDVQDEIECYENPYANYVKLHNEDSKYVDLDTSSTGNSIKLNTAKSAKEDSKFNIKSDKNITSDSNVENVNEDSNKEYIVDGDYVRIPGDPYPYSRENLDKWRVPRIRSLIYKPIKRETSLSGLSSIARSSPRNVNDAYTNAAKEPRDSHARAVMETSGSGDDASAKNAGRTSGFHVSSRDQRVVSDCLRGDAADALRLRRWTEAFSPLDVGANASEKMNEATRGGDNGSYRAYYE